MYKVKIKRTPFTHGNIPGIEGQEYSDSWDESIFEFKDDNDELINDGDSKEEEMVAIQEAKEQFGRKNEGIDWMIFNSRKSITFNNQTGKITRKALDEELVLC